MLHVFDTFLFVWPSFSCFVFLEMEIDEDGT